MRHVASGRPGPPAARACPECSAGLEPAALSNALAGILGHPEVQVDRCAGCGGAFFDREEFGWFTGDMRVDHGENEEAAGPSFGCPACGDPMRARVGAGHAFAACDACGGRWLGAPALARLL